MKLYSDRITSTSLRRSLIGAAVLALCSGSAMAIDPFVIKDIRVEGIQRTEAGTVFSYLPVRVGETFNDDKSITAIKALYATGFFKDVKLEKDGQVLVVLDHVVERGVSRWVRSEHEAVLFVPLKSGVV